ncbi:phytoene desaturase family protein [Salipaludibacillus sp. HK11]|uniref:phytoene desaturase family protein n=1 Tax=Salipaludibacillus sp. HK11 TaxID=3394320 RepID=UPI0039FD7872
MSKSWDVIIIGGGLAGYVAATFVAKANLSVLLLEKGKKVGGRARTDILSDQYFNLGPHALYKNGEAKKILTELGLTLDGKSPKLHGILVENNKEYAAPFAPVELFSTKYLNWKEKIEWLSILMKIRGLKPDEYANQTFQQFVNQFAKSEKNRALLYTLARLSAYCHAPEMVSAKVIISQIQTGMSGVIYLNNGWQMMIDQLHNKAIVSGVKIQEKTSAQQIIPLENDQVKIRTSNDEVFYAKHVISTTGPHELSKMIPKNNTYDTDHFLSEVTPLKGATLDIALNELPCPKRLFAMGLTNKIYYSVHSTYAQLSKTGLSHVLHVFKYHHPNDSLDPIEIKNELEHFLEQMQPRWREYEISSRFLPNIIVNQRLPLVGDEQRLQRLKLNDSGIYVSGDWVSPDSILSEGAISSAKRAAHTIIDKEKRSKSADHKRRIHAI